MKITLQLGKEEITELTIERDWFTGSFFYLENGKKQDIRSPFSISTHFNFKLTHEHEFTVGNKEIHQVKLVHTRPLLFGGFRDNTYEVFVNGELVKTYVGT